MRINIIYQDSNFLVVEKPSGLIVHPWSECADNISLLHLLKEQTGKYIYPVHRLDRPVSGVMIFALSSEAASLIKGKWNLDSTQKIYVGLCKGEVTQAQYISYPLHNQARTKKQNAKTFFWPLESNGHVSLNLFKIVTGRYHQIRRHSGAMGNQLIGDTKYGKGNFNRFYRENYNLHRLFLHCCGLQIELGEAGVMRFISPLTSELRSVVKKLNFSFNISSDIFNYDESILTEYSRRKNIENGGDKQ